MQSRTNWTWALVVAGSLVALACGAAFVAPEVDSRLVSIGASAQPPSSEEELRQGRELFVQSCGRGGFCHKLPTPKSRSAERWPGILDKMAPKAGLNAEERNLVQRFILAVRELPDANP
ncbi:MAG TPA: hypothetical protein PLQ97_01180 [Myxococcota bacterium]|nr:hypothetical protein [Myxococcota bacterium]HQK49788.1 hypothetical protein [Myxococcota bacterium]